MQFKWVDYCEEYEAETETWKGDEDTVKFAIDNSIKEEHKYYLSPNDDDFKYKPGEEYFCKVVLDGDIIAAVLFILRGEGYPVAINPIIVNPKHRNKGYCTKIICELINNIREITGFDSDIFDAGIDLDNKASIRAFEKNGFVLHETHPDGDFATWQYEKK